MDSRRRPQVCAHVNYNALPISNIDSTLSMITPLPDLSSTQELSAMEISADEKPVDMTAAMEDINHHQ